MISLLVGMSMMISADVDMFCHKAHQNTANECIWYVEECITDGEKPLWCLADYEQSIKEGKEE